MKTRILSLLALFSTLQYNVLSFSSTQPLLSTHSRNVASHQQQRLLSLLFVSTLSSSDESDTTDTITNEQQQQQQQPPPPITWKDDGFVFGLDNNSPLQRTKGQKPTAVTVVDGDSLETQPYQVALVSASLLAHTAVVTSGLVALQQDSTLIAATLLVTLSTSWFAADVGSAIFHWSVDNYGNGKTPVLGSVIAAFQGHHLAPWTITERSFFNNVYKLCIPFGLGGLLIESGATVLSNTAQPGMGVVWMSAFCVWVILSQEFHKWSHMASPPPIAKWLQSTGVAVGKVTHAQHHQAPYAGRYGIVSGISNEWMDRNYVWRRLERIVYGVTGVEANTWKLDPELREQALRGDYE